MSKNISASTVKIFLIMLSNLQKMHLKLLQKEQFKKQLKQLAIFFGKKVTDKITKDLQPLPKNSSVTVTYETENIEHNR